MSIDADEMREIGNQGFEYEAVSVECGKILGRAERIDKLDAAHAVLKRLSDFQHVYSRCTHGCDMPGNDLYSGIAMSIVRDARVVLGPESEIPLTAGEMQEVLYAGHAALEGKK